jgi:hypothetical protein
MRVSDAWCLQVRFTDNKKGVIERKKKGDNKKSVVTARSADGVG